MTDIRLVRDLEALVVPAVDGGWLFVIEDGKPCVSEDRDDLRALRKRFRNEGYQAEIRPLRSKPKESNECGTTSE